MKGDPSSQHYEITNQDESQCLQGQISNARGQVTMLSNAVLCGSSSLQLCLSACVRFPRVLTCSLSALGNCKQCFLKYRTISNNFLCSTLWICPVTLDFTLAAGSHELHCEVSSSVSQLDRGGQAVPYLDIKNSGVKTSNALIRIWYTC